MKIVIIVDNELAEIASIYFEKDYKYEEWKSSWA